MKCKTGKVLTLDEQKLKEDEDLDGYYETITSEMEESDLWVKLKILWLKQKNEIFRYSY